jgi:hypothetical protein
MRLLAVLFCATIAAAQHPRDSWKLPAISLEEPLPHSLADAPLSAAEREQVFSALDNRMHDDRKMIMSTRIGLIALATNGSKQILALGPQTCNGAANFCLSIFVREGGRVHLALNQGGIGLLVARTSHDGFNDITVAGHMSSVDTMYEDYRWDGTVYEAVDCYIRRDDSQGATPKISDCQKALLVRPLPLQK